ncbi:MAG: glucose 1-dehydrogenase [Pseudomonadota bacterium]
MRVKDKVALVTGSGRGLGKGAAIRLAEEGANVVVNVSRSVDEAEQVVNEIREMGRKSFCYKADVSKKTEVDTMVDNIIKEFGKIDILVNNAGVNRDNFIQNMSEEEWDTVIDTNLKGAFNCLHAVSKHMIEQKYGKIINVSSIGHVGNIGSINYGSSKGGLITFTRCAALELARYNINVNCVGPGVMDAGLFINMPQKIKDKLLKKIPLQRVGTLRDFGNVILFLASDESSYVTGTLIMVDAGITLGYI